MNKEDKELLLKDLCARLPYGVICEIYSEKCTITEKLLFGGISHFADDTICVRPYLRPLSSMTEEERNELQKITNNNFYASSNYISNSNTPLDGEWHASYNSFVTNAVCNKLISWLDKNHFDHRTDEEGKTLIEKRLAIPVTEENNPYEN